MVILIGQFYLTNENRAMIPSKIQTCEYLSLIYDSIFSMKFSKNSIFLSNPLSGYDFVMLHSISEIEIFSDHEKALLI